MVFKQKSQLNRFYATIQVIRHDMDPNIYLNNSRKTHPVFSEKKGGKYQKIAELFKFKIRKIINTIFSFDLQSLTSRILKFGDRELCTLTKA